MPARLRDAALAAAAGVLLALACGQALRRPLVDNDSFAVVYSQTALDRPEGLADLASPAYFTTYGIGGWRPLSTLAYAAVLRAGGTDPYAYTLFKFTLHALSSALVFAIGLVLLRDRRWALAGAAAYFLRLQQPAFDGLAFFPDFMAAFFCLAAVLSRLRGRTFLAAGLYACALLSKESALALPALLLLVERCFPAARDERAGSRAALWPLALVAVLYLGASKWWIVVENFYGPARWAVRGPAAKVLRAYASYWREFFGGDAALAAGALGLAWAAADRRSRTGAGRWLLFCLGWTWLTLWSVLNVWPFFPKFEAYLLRAESRFLVLPGAAMAWLLGYWGSACERRRAAGLLARALAAWWLASGAVKDLRERAGWSERLRAGLPASVEAFAASRRPLYESDFSRTLLSLPLIRRADPGLAAEIEGALRRALPGRDAEALLEFFGSESLYREGWRPKLAPRLMNQESLAGLLAELAPEAGYRRGEELLALGRPREAAAEFRASLAADPEHEASCLGLAAAYQAGGQARRAAAQAAACRDYGLLGAEFPPEGAARAAVRESEEAFSRALAGRRWSDALRSFDSLRGRMGPQWRVDLQMSRAGALVRGEKYREAERAYESALRGAPSAWRGRGEAERELSRLRRGSRAQFEAAMRRYAEGDADKAIAGFSEALRLSPDFAEAYLSRGALYADRGRWDAAAKDYEAGLRQPSSSENPILRENLRSALAAANRR